MMSKEYTDLELNKMLQDATTNLIEPYDTMVLEMVNRLVTPPTAEEVCEALNGYLYPLDYEGEPNFVYNERTKTFQCSNGWYIFLSVYGQVEIYFISLSPDLIELIGRFYKGLTDGE